MFVESINKHIKGLGMPSNKVQEGKVNRTRTIDLIRSHPGISRIEAADQLGLNRSTLTHIVNDFLSKGLIREEKKSSAVGERGGRIPIGLRIEERYILGVEWQDMFFRYSLSGLNGQQYRQGQIELEDHSVNLIKEELYSLVKTLELEEGIKISGIGLALPGRINPHKGIVLESVPLDLKDFDLPSLLSSYLNIPVLIENDANCFAWGEVAERQDFRGNLLCMLLEFHSNPLCDNWDQEVGIGIVSSGEVYHGSSYSAGELQISPVIDTLRTNFLKELEEDGSGDALASLEYCSLLFRTLNPVISTLDPELLILGGDFYLHRSVLEEPLKKAIPFTWCFSEKGNMEVAAGAASFFIKTIFSLPDFQDDVLMRGVWEEILQ